MRLATNLSGALHSLRVHPLRSVLTMLGVVVGVAAVITVMALGEGARQGIIAQIQSLGGNLLLVTPGSAHSQGVHLGIGSGETLTEGDATAITLEISGVLSVAPSVYKREQVVRGNANWSTTVQGITNAFLTAREWPVRAGRPFTAREQEGAAKVAVLGDSVASRLFDGSDPVGEIIRVGGIPFEVVGLLEPKGQSSAGADQDDKVMIPLSTARTRLIGSGAARLGAVQYIMVKVDEPDRMAAVEEEIRLLLRQRHGIRPETEDDFQVRNLADVQASREAASGVLTFWLSAVASVSLIVGGISIMNIMLVSVTERTREIGLRLAVGARATDIGTQFLAEAVALSLIGAAMGVAAGVGAAFVIATLQGLPILVRTVSLVTAAGFALMIGVFFGLYPAVKAARLSPVDALRAE